jgi:hypothetical protein
MVFLSILLAAFLIRKSGDPIRVALAIFVAQNADHFILGGHANSDGQMLFSHISAGLVSYHLLRYFDRNLPDLGRALISLLAPSLPKYITDIPIPAHSQQPLFNFVLVSRTTSYLKSSITLQMV